MRQVINRAIGIAVEMVMESRRSVLKVCLGLCACAAGTPWGRGIGINASPADQRVDVQGRGYDLHFIGAQRETVLNGKLAASLDLRTLASTQHLYGLGPIEHLRGEVTIANSRPALARIGPNGNVHVAESFASGVPFFVWAEVPTWQALAIPSHIRSYSDLEKFIPEAANSVGVDPRMPLPFVLRGRSELIEFHVLNRVGGEPHDAKKHREIQAVFELGGVDATMVGFCSPGHRGIFTPMESTIHIHFQSVDNKTSGHVQKIKLAEETTLWFPSP